MLRFRYSVLLQELPGIGAADLTPDKNAFEQGEVGWTDGG